jgi:fibronectin-binding autotransporter adhesin
VATRTVKATGGNWSATGTWNEGVVPTAADDVVFLAGSATLTVDGTSGSPSLCRSIDTTNWTGTITMGATAQLNVGDGTTGAFKATAGMTFAPNATSLIKFVSTTTGNNITWGGYTYGLITFDGVGGAWTFQDALAMSTRTLTLTNGSLNTNGKTLTTGNFSSNNSNTRSLTLGATSWTLAAGTGWDIGTSTGMTLSAASSTITMSNATGAVNFAGGGLTYGTVTCTALTSGIITFTGANTFGTLTTSNGASQTGYYALAANQTVTGTWTANGNSVTNRLLIRSDVKGTARTLSAGTVTVSNIDIQDITAAGAGNWNISACTGLSGDCGGNTGITFTTGINCYWKSGTGSWSNSGLWKTTSNGAIGARTPLPQDTAIFDAFSFTAGSQTVTQDMPRIGAVNFTGATNTPAWSKGSLVVSFFGSITTIAAMTHSGAGTGAYTYEGRSNSTLTTNGLTWINPIGVNSTGSNKLSLGDAFTGSASTGSDFVITSGIFDAATFNVTLSGASAAFAQSGGTVQCTSGTFSMSGTSSASFTLSGGTFDYSNGTYSMTGAGSAMTLSGGTFNAGTVSRAALSFPVTGSTVVIGSGGITCGAFSESTGAITMNGVMACSTFTKNGAGSMALNAASTASGAMSFSSTGTLTLNANLTGSSTLAITGQTITFGTGTTLAFNNGSLTSPAIGAVKKVGAGGGLVG